jgi:type VI secretion system protein ImpH
VSQRTPAQAEAELASLFEALAARPRMHDFFAVLRRVESLRADLPRIGRAARPSLEVLRLGSEAEMDFAPASLAVFEPDAPGAPRLGVRFFGLLGPQGPMPTALTEYVRDRLRSRGDATLARFLDMFHHRLLSLFYRAWAQSQPATHLDRPQDDRFSAWLGSSIGSANAAHGAGHLPEHARLFQAGLLGARSRHPEGLAKLLSGHFGVPIRIEQHVAQWLVPEAADRSRLGFAGSRPERNRLQPPRLGASANAGNKVRDRQFKFRVVVGPMAFEDYEAFLPGTPRWLALADWVRSYAGLHLRHDVQLVLAGAQVARPCLGHRVRLGVSTWIGRDEPSRDRDELRLRPDTSFLARRAARTATEPEPTPA